MAYRVHIRQFDGPLDLLLHLIGRAAGAAAGGAT